MSRYASRLLEPSRDKQRIESFASILQCLVDSSSRCGLHECLCRLVDLVFYAFRFENLEEALLTTGKARIYARQAAFGAKGVKIVCNNIFNILDIIILKPA